MITLSDLTIKVGAFRVEAASLAVPTGGYAVLMGRSGSGKTTLLEAVCGLRPVAAGTVEVGGRDVTRLAPARRGIGFVPQEGALFSGRTVRAHLAFAPTVQGWDREAIDERTETLAGALGISGLLDRTPHGLSGGERQRVALGRALAARPPVLCLDEPLSGLDAETHAETLELLRSAAAAGPTTTLHITHDPTEAEALATHRFRIEDGRVRPV